jgi:hypothetical protein
MGADSRGDPQAFGLPADWKSMLPTARWEAAAHLTDEQLAVALGFSPRVAGIARDIRSGFAYRHVPANREPCAAYTKAGTPCWHPSLIEDRFCHVHVTPERRRRIEKQREQQERARELQRQREAQGAVARDLRLRRRVPLRARKPIDAAKRVSYTVSEASRATGISVSVIRAAYRSGWLPVRYVTARPVILATDLVQWIESAPQEREVGRPWPTR